MGNVDQANEIWQVLFSRDVAIAKAREKHKADYEEILRLHELLQKNQSQHSDELLLQLVHKEAVIQEKEAAIQQQAIALQEKQKSIEELASAADERLQIIQEQQQKIAQNEHAIEQLKRQQQHEIQTLRQSKNLRIRRATAALKEQRQVIREQVGEIEILRRSLESTVDRRIRRKLSHLSHLFD